MSFLRFAVDLLGGLDLATDAMDDEALAKRMGDGDDRAFQILYERYFDKVYAYVARRVASHEIAEDLTSEIFVKAFTHRQRFVWRTCFAAWLFRIAANRLTDHYRAKKPEQSYDPELHDVADPAVGSGAAQDIRLLREELERVLEKLNERERNALCLKFYAELGNDEVAAALGVTANNAGVILHRALKKCEALATDRLKAMMA